MKMNYLGSKDAGWLLHLAETKKLPITGQRRLAQFKGLVNDDEQNLSRAMQVGVDTELSVFEKIKKAYPEAIHEPFFLSQKIKPQRFAVGNHIDFEFADSPYLVWVELKTTKDGNLNDYMPQLQWHYMLLEERAEEGGHTPILQLLIIRPEGDIQKQLIAPDRAMIAKLQEGIRLADEMYDGVTWTYTSGGLELLPSQLAGVVPTIIDIEEQMRAMRKRYDELTTALRDAMIKNNIKNISADGIIITLVPESESVSIDTAKLKAEMPEIAERYKKVTSRKAYIKITLK